MKRLALLGASGHGKVVADAALACGWQAIDFFDDVWPEKDKIGAWPIVGDSAALAANLNGYDGILVSIGHCAVRLEKHNWLQSINAPLVSIVHPSAQFSRFATLGAGTVVMPGAAINADAQIGSACIVNTGATVDHDCILEDGVHIGPGAHVAGSVSISTGAWIGIGAAIKQGISVGAWAIVGAGAVVIHPVAAGLTVVGNPAKPLYQSGKPD